jgi:hypothetical protein
LEIQSRGDGGAPARYVRRGRNRLGDGGVRKVLVWRRHGEENTAPEHDAGRGRGILRRGRRKVHLRMCDAGSKRRARGLGHEHSDHQKRHDGNG